MKDKIKLLSVKSLKSGKKKYEAKFQIEKSNGKTRNKTIKFGAKGMSDFTIHKDTERRDRYISRHKKDLRTNDPTRAGYLSMYILWNKKTFKASLADYKRRLNTYNRTGKFPIAISGSILKSKFGNNSDINKYFNETNFGVKFKDDPEIKIYEVEKLKRRQYPNDNIRKNSIKNKRIYFKEFNELSLEFAKFIGDMQYKSLFINSNFDCLLYIFKTFFKKYKKIIDKNEFIKYYNTYFYADERLKDKSCINDKGILIITLFNTEAGKNMIEKFNNFVERKIELNNRMRNSNFGSNENNEKVTFDDLPDDLKKYIFKLVKFKLQKERINEYLNNITNFLNEPDIDNLDINNLDNIGINNLDINNFGKYKVPDNVKNKSLYLRIKNKIGKEVKKKGRRWGAYDSGRLVREYKEKGGKYSGKKSTKTKSKKSSNLDRWYREKWIDACAWPKRKSCGRTKASIKSKVTYCRPSKVIDRNTPKTIQELTKAEIKRKCAKKSKNPKKIVR